LSASGTRASSGALAAGEVLGQLSPQAEREPRASPVTFALREQAIYPGRRELVRSKEPG
jgi:hypothetical protein